ncbi:hypothetical protein BDV25DRAFT_149837 [Aspergillus avenaceus]|uniref:Uncharacterized protein n=1 Tax=Aspergillus avenaceus TaxID=36643 RepID=A0A5N6U3L3_ASPAV|nr:hypothetical protein BDV25DRAFT_149837 [Aspergillus avenaceus]
MQISQPCKDYHWIPHLFMYIECCILSFLAVDYLLNMPLLETLFSNQGTGKKRFDMNILHLDKKNPRVYVSMNSTHVYILLPSIVTDCWAISRGTILKTASIRLLLKNQ